MTRRILQLDGAKISVSAESRFDSERDLHDAVAAHPEVLPSEDLGLGPLVALGTDPDDILSRASIADDVRLEPRSTSALIRSISACWAAIRACSARAGARVPSLAERVQAFNQDRHEIA